MLRTAKTENGLVRGLPAADPRVTSFKGIPFAAPPVGENRWKVPQPCKNWEGTLDAYRFAPISVQDTPGLGTDIYCREWHVDPEIPMSEDCLYLNVWTNAKTTGDKLPVLVWFFGGAFQWGYPSEMEFDGERIARRGVIVVTVNYRLNVFGFLAHPELTKEQPDAPANFGLLDQQAGIKWVIRNIKEFGGDPENITIAGQSAGGGSVMAQLTSPSGKGLFQKAIVMSGIIRSPYGPSPIAPPLPLHAAEEQGRMFLEFAGISGLAEARKLDASYLLQKYNEFAAVHSRMYTVQDGVFCVGDPLALYAANRHAGVPVMAGNTSNEFLSFLPAADETELKEQAAALFGSRAEEFLAFPEASVRYGDHGYAPVSGIECKIKDLFLQNQKNGNKENCYYYRFDADIPGWDNPGNFHSVELWFFFETLAKCWRPFEGRHYDLARHMCNYMTNFIKTGNPNGADHNGNPMPEWNSYTKEHPAEMTFRTDGLVTGERQESPFISFLMEQVHNRQA